jgi:hypothetical protein
MSMLLDQPRQTMRRQYAARGRRPAPRFLAPASRCAAIAILVTTALVAIAVAISTAYHAKAAYHLDSASYRFQAAKLYEHYELAGRWTTAWDAFHQQSSFDTIVRLCVWPESLCHCYGQLWVQAPLMALFFFLTAWYVYRQTGSYLFGFAVVATTFLFGQVYYPYQGLADYWKEMLAVWILGSALVSWFLSDQASREGWSFLSGLLWGLLVLQRPVMAVYGSVLFLPFLANGIYRRCRQDTPGRFAWRAIAFGAAPVALGTIAIVVQGSAVYHYYFVMGYGYTSWSVVAETLLQGYMLQGFGFRLALGICFGLCLAASWRHLWQRLPDAIVAMWLTIGLFGLIVASRALYHGFYAMAMVMAVVGLARLAPRHLSLTSTRTIALVLLAVTAGAAVKQEVAYANNRAVLAQTNQENRQFFEELGAVVQAAPPDVRVGFFFDECFELLWNQLYFDHGSKLADHRFFMSIHDTYYKGVFGDLEPKEIAAAIVAEMERTPHALVVIHNDPADLERWIARIEFFPNSISVKVNARIGEHLRHSAHWRMVQRIESASRGQLLVYESCSLAAAVPPVAAGADH